MTTLLLHEGQPGHHFHMALARELPLPRGYKTGAVSTLKTGNASFKPCQAFRFLQTPGDAFESALNKA